MGCSPSKGNNFGTQGPFRRGRTLLPGTQECAGEPQYDDGEGGGSAVPAEGDLRERRSAGPTHCAQREPPLTPQKKRASVSELAPEAVTLDKQGTQGMDNSRVTPGKEKQGDKQDATDKKTAKKPKKNNRGIKPQKKKEKEKKATLPEQKVDFPEPLVKAHQAAYAFLNPSINKYDILLGLLEQATQTQTNLQPMVAFMVLRYEEINRALEGVVDEGERLLKENGEHLAWPSPLKNLSSSPLKMGPMDDEPPPDLLQQLLQYTTQRMRNVSQTVGGIGDSAMEEAVEYFASLSELLDEKLKAKHAVEARLMRLLTRIEAASLRKPGPEDSAIFSEDSGIGAENESLAGSERRHRRGSSESTGTNRTTPSPMRCNNRNMRQGASKSKITSQMTPSVSLTSIDSICTLIAGDQKDTESLLGSVSLDDEEEDADEEETDGDTGDSEVCVRKRSNSSPAKPDQKPHRLPPKRIENPQNVEMTLKMKDAISGRIQFVPSQHACAKAKLTESPKTSRRQWAEDEERSPRRPQTAAPVRKGAAKKTPVAKERRTRSTESLRSKAEDPTLLELERTQRDLSQRIERMRRQTGTNTSNKVPSKQSQGNAPGQSIAASRISPALERNSPQPIKDKAGLMKHSNEEQEAMKDVVEDKKKKDKKKASKGPLKATPPPSPPSSRPPSGLSRGRNSVKRLIDTFSQGIEELESPKVLGPLKGVRRCGVPVLPGLGNVEAALSSRISSCRAETVSTYKMEDLDLANLPPPPLEVLLDNSFEGARSISANEADERAANTGRSAVGKKAMVSRLRASVQSVAVLPSKVSLLQGSRVDSTTISDHQDTSSEAHCQPDLQPEVDSDVEQAASLYKQSRKIIHLRHSSDSALDISSLCNHIPTPGLSPAASAEEEDGSCRSVHDSNNSLCTAPPTSVSRARMLPSTPSTASSSHRRLPSPHAFRKQPSSSSLISPPNNRKLPTPPAAQRMLQSSPVARQSFANVNSASSNSFKAPSPPASPKVHRRNNSNTNSPHSFFKAPSPPASPKVQRWTRENSGEDVCARSKSNARSVFCPVSPSLFEAQPCPAPSPPQAWTSTGISVLPRPWRNQGRLPPFVRGPQPFIRRSHSDRRPSLTLPLRASGNFSVAEICGSEPSLSTQGLEDEPVREELWSIQSDLRAKARSASHPDLCVVGQALHLE